MTICAQKILLFSFHIIYHRQHTQYRVQIKWTQYPHIPRLKPVCAIAATAVKNSQKCPVGIWWILNKYWCSSTQLASPKMFVVFNVICNSQRGFWGFSPPSCLFGLIDPLGHTQQQLNIQQICSKRCYTSTVLCYVQVCTIARFIWSTYFSVAILRYT